MKLNVLFFLVLFVNQTLLGQSINSQYSLKSGKIVYRLEFAESVIKYTLGFDEFGKKQYFDIQSSNEHTRTFISQESMYVLNFEDKQALKIPLVTLSQADDLFGGFNLQGMMEAINQSGKTRLRQENVLGKTCDVFEFTETEGMKGKYWVWKEFLLKADYIDENGEHSYMEAKELSMDIPLDQSLFEIPSGFSITDMEQLNKLQEMYGVPDMETEEH